MGLKNLRVFFMYFFGSKMSSLVFFWVHNIRSIFFFWVQNIRWELTGLTWLSEICFSLASHEVNQSGSKVTGLKPRNLPQSFLEVDIFVIA